MSGVGSGHSGSASGGQLEERVDLSGEVQLKLPQAASLVQAGQLQEALALLAALEKKCRVGNDAPSLVLVVEAAVQHCHDAGDTDALCSTLTTFSTRRSQKTQAIRAMVHKAMPWCVHDGHVPNDVSSEAEKSQRNRLVETLLSISDGKIFLEAERARLTRAMAMIKEADGDIAGAAMVLQDVHVETYGSLSKKEKVEFILEQIRLTLSKQDYVRASIVAGKISRKVLMEEDSVMQEYKVRYFTLMAQYHRRRRQGDGDEECDALELAKAHHAIYLTPNILKVDAQWQEALQSAVLYLALSPYSNEQQDLMHRIQADSNVEKLPACQATLQLLLRKEIIPYPLPHQAELEAWPAFTEDGLAPHWKEVFHRRIIQHNIRVVAAYYQRIRGRRLAQLLGLSPERLESELSRMVSDGSVYAKMDRPRDIIRFTARPSPEAVLSAWASDVDKLLALVDTTSHLIQKENMTSAPSGMSMTH